MKKSTRSTALCNLTAAALLLTGCGDQFGQSEPSEEPVAVERPTTVTPTPSPIPTTSTHSPEPVEPPSWVLTAEEYDALPDVMTPTRPIPFREDGFSQPSCVLLPGGNLYLQEFVSTEDGIIPHYDSFNMKTRYERRDSVNDTQYPECENGEVAFLYDSMLSDDHYGESTLQKVER